jgi:hypothetical protein
MTTALLDGDIIAFKASAVTESEVDWDNDGNVDKIVSPEEAAKAALVIAEEWRRKAGADRAIVCFTDRSIPEASFRYLFHPLYKRHRTGSKPACYFDAVAALEGKYKTATLPRLEADDVMGILATGDFVPGPVIVSADKDMMTIPARVLIPGKMRKPIKVSPFNAFAHWMIQTMAGDAVDGFKGCPGIGIKRATSIIENAEEQTPQGIWAAVVKAFEAKKLTEEHAIAEARCARILRADDFDKENMRIRLWHPREKEWISLTSLPNPS